jgi:pyridoxine 5-phosphate synthase
MEVAMAELAVNVDHVALLRSKHDYRDPDPVAAALLAELAGAAGIVVRLHGDRRHTRDRDVVILREVIQTQLILEMASTTEMVGVALDAKPDAVILIPQEIEDQERVVGLDLIVDTEVMAETIGTLQNGGISAGIAIAPDPEQVKLAHQVNANAIQIYTGEYCTATSGLKRQQALDRILNAARLARKLKLGIQAGSGITYQTINALCQIQEIELFSIGQSIIARALLVGMDTAVRDMVARLHVP